MSFINEKLLFHGLGDLSKALNIIGSGFNEHFSGVNAGTMFGDGVYLAEDMGKSISTVTPRQRSVALSLVNRASPASQPSQLDLEPEERRGRRRAGC